jgi:hypothetical protein
MKRSLTLGLAVAALGVAPAVASADSVSGIGQLTGHGVANANFAQFNGTSTSDAFGAATGTASVTDTSTGASIGGPLTCLSAVGSIADFIITPTTGGAPTTAAYIFVVQDNGTNPFTPLDTLSNSALTAKQLAKIAPGGVCPDPTTLTAPKNPLAAGNLMVTDNT